MISKKQRLVTHPELNVRFINSHEIEVKTTDEWRYVGHHCLPILQAFVRPCSVELALKNLKNTISGKQDWIDLTTSLYLLKKYDFLVDSQSTSSASHAREAYQQPIIHTQMLNDSVRTQAFLDAIDKTVQPGDIVVEIGTGTGVLAIAAARAGAAKVYAIEASGIADVAEQLIKENGYQDIIQVVRGWSTQVTLPEKCDLLISEMLGNDPFAEQVNELTLDAIERFLKDDFTLVPSHIDVELSAFEAPEQFLSSIIYTHNNTSKWSEDYQINFCSLTDQQEQNQLIMYLPQKTSQWKALSKPTLICSIDLYQQHLPDLSFQCELTTTESGSLNTLMLHYRLTLAEDVYLDIAPGIADINNHWTCPVWLINQATPVKKNNTIRIDNYRKHSHSPGKVTIQVK
ncbi:MAG: 50S ribosomal protein L11 methyltransferase [bacterium]